MNSLLQKAQEIAVEKLNELHIFDRPEFQTLFGYSFGIPQIQQKGFGKLLTPFAVPRSLVRTSEKIFKHTAANLNPYTIALKYIGAPKKLIDAWKTILSKWKVTKGYYSLLYNLEKQTHNNPLDLFFSGSSSARRWKLWT